MPLQLYDKEQILDACLAVFARHGYKNTSTTMLAEAAGLSTVLTHEHSETGNPKNPKGTLAYIAPEQTGRMNRPMPRDRLLLATKG